VCILRDSPNQRDCDQPAIAQDTTDYGQDLGIKNGLASLLENLVSAVPDVDWLRVMYAYPGYLQHANPAVLRRMRRPANIDWVYSTLESMRYAMPNLALRTTFIVGYPGETEAEFQTLLDFIGTIHFDRVGAFQFSFETGTSSEVLGDPIPSEIKTERWERLMGLQRQISLERNQEFIGKQLDVLIEGQGVLEDEQGEQPGEQISLGRSYRDAPEIDGMVIVEGAAPIGDIVRVGINGAMVYDLSAKLVSTVKMRYG